MRYFREYLLEPEALDELAAARLGRVVERYPWFSTARLLLAKARRRSDPLVQLRFTGRPLPGVLLERPTEAYFVGGGETLSAISRFLARPAAGNETPSEAIPEGDFSADSISEDPDLVSEELAQVYLSQGLTDRARGVYEKLSLLYPEKSVYFAELIARIGEPSGGDESQWEP